MDPATCRNASSLPFVNLVMNETKSDSALFQGRGERALAQNRRIDYDNNHVSDFLFFFFGESVALEVEATAELEATAASAAFAALRAFFLAFLSSSVS